MPSADDLRRAITKNRKKFSDAISAASDRWESGDDNGWSPRKIAQHGIGRDKDLTDMAVGALNGISVTKTTEVSFSTAVAALAALEAVSKAADGAYRSVQDGDLSKPAPLHLADSPSNNIEGVMVRAASHLLDHARQIVKA